MTPTLSSIVEQLQQAGQSHLLGFVDQLGESELQSLLQQIAYLDLELVKSKLKTPIFIDLRNVYEPETMKTLGFEYYSIGR